MLNKDIHSYSALFPKEYTELRVQENRSNGVALLNGDVVSNGRSAASGVSARIFKDGQWGFASNPNISDDAVESVIRSSTDNVRFMNKRDTSRCGIMLPETFINFEKSLPLGQKKLCPIRYAGPSCLSSAMLSFKLTIVCFILVISCLSMPRSCSQSWYCLVLMR